MQDQAALPQLQLLGTPAARVAGQALVFPSRKCVGLLAVLALDGPTPRARLAAMLWEDHNDADARRNLRRELQRLRDAGFEALLATQNHSVALHPAVQVDVAIFAAACASAVPEQVLALHAGPLLDGWDLPAAPAFQAWLAAQRHAMAQRWCRAAQTHCDALQAAGRQREALALATRLMHEDLLQESHYRRAMQLHADLGQTAEALACYARCEHLLSTQLGLQPLAQTKALARAIGQRTTPPMLAGGGASGLQPLHTATGPVRPAPGGHDAPDGANGADAAVTPPFVGRSALLQALRQHLQQHSLTVLRGEAGIGKTRLLQAVLQDGPGGRLHEARPGDADTPYAALARWLRAARLQPAQLPTWVQVELSRLLPEWHDPGTPARPDTQRLRLFEAARVAWTQAFGNAPLQVFDDWQFVDPSSALWWSWWRGQAPAQGAAPLLVALRPLAGAADTLAALHDPAPTATVDLPPLAADELLALVRQWSGCTHAAPPASAADPAQPFAQLLWQATAGHPLYALQTLQHLLHTGALRIDTQGHWHTPDDGSAAAGAALPIAPSVQAALLQRVQALDDAPRRLLQAASLMGDDFTLSQVAAASALDDADAVQALEQALQARVLVQQPAQPGAYRFTHELFAQALADEPTPERRRLMHRALGQRLAQEGSAAARVAHHFTQAGDTELACQWRLHALAQARHRALPADVLLQASHVLALAPQGQAAVRAHLARCSALLSLAQGDAAALALHQACALLQAGDPVGLQVDVVAMQAYHSLNGGQDDDAIPALSHLLQDPRLTALQRGRLLKRRSACYRKKGQQAQADADGDAALQALLGEPGSELGDLYDDRARNAMSRGDFAEVLANGQRAVELMQRVDDPGAAAAPMTMCGVALLCMGRHDEALVDLQRAREIAHAHGLVSVERGAILNLVPTLLALGRAADAVAVLEAGYALSAWFRGQVEQQAFIEARYQCQVVLGDLGAALDQRPELVRFSLGVGELHRRVSGLLVSMDLPLTLGHADGARAEVQAVLVAMGPQPTGYLARTALDKAAWLALLDGQPASALQHTQAAQALPQPTPQEQALHDGVHALALLACGRGTEARAALTAQADGVDHEVWGQYLAAALQVQHATGGVHPACRAQAEAALQAGTLPPLARLELMDALLGAWPGHGPHTAHTARTELSTQAQALARRLSLSLGRHEAERGHLHRRFARWLEAEPAH